MAAAGVKVDLDAPLDGHHLIVNPDALTFGVLEDLTSEAPKAILDALAAVIVGGDLPKGTDRDGLRALGLAEVRALVRGVAGAMALPKGS